VVVGLERRVRIHNGVGLLEGGQRRFAGSPTMGASLAECAQVWIYDSVFKVSGKAKRRGHPFRVLHSERVLDKAFLLGRGDFLGPEFAQGSVWGGARGGRRSILDKRRSSV